MIKAFLPPNYRLSEMDALSTNFRSTMGVVEVYLQGARNQEQIEMSDASAEQVVARFGTLFITKFKVRERWGCFFDYSYLRWIA